MRTGQYRFFILRFIVVEAKKTTPKCSGTSHVLLDYRAHLTPTFVSNNYSSAIFRCFTDVCQHRTSSPSEGKALQTTKTRKLGPEFLEAMKLCRTAAMHVSSLSTSFLVSKFLRNVWDI
jgi:hypothetical protein